MIPLRLRAESIANQDPIVLRLNSSKVDVAAPEDIWLVESNKESHVYQGPAGHVRVFGAVPDDIDGDVVLLIPSRKTAHRLVRRASRHNSFLVTERCDQLCVMCSQPPKAHHEDLFPFFRQAALLAPQDAVLGITGGEPTLYKNELFDLLEASLAIRPDLNFHILSNGQHLTNEDKGRLADLPKDQIEWGIPIYDSEAHLHDEIVGKEGAFSRLRETLALLAQTGATIELRTVLMRQNAARLPLIADHIATDIPFAAVWAIMQLENIGYARMNWADIFFDHSGQSGPLEDALAIALVKGVAPRLYNFPLCTLPEYLRAFAPASISDWKQRFLEDCDGCRLKSECCGFFEWYRSENGYEGVRPI